MYDCDSLSKKFNQRVAANTNNFTIIYTPRGYQLQRPFTRQQIELVFDCMRELIKYGIIHRDITPNHLLSIKSSSGEIEQIFLIDFGSATFVEMDSEFNNSSLAESSDDDEGHTIQVADTYRGSIRFAATKILKQLLHK